ncbi:YhdP family protein [Ovoidimarina sediminis]|uniref:YhdP family protein n=1 Tax=Ovoidimarina sediminis TaxID=3079856 RepID=UPI00290E0154|nr:DUF3971 domain-containing protein [Rhodophyticola sp. MJ-SS7]MDU8945045.1 DUF3971 domain-containing protein [Rhodophyticola sp. MJ-SS7]
MAVDPDPEAPATPEADDARPERAGRRWPLYALALPTILVGLMLGLFYAVEGRTIALPAPLSERLEAELAQGLGQGRVRIGGAEVRLDSTVSASIVLRDVIIRDGGGARLAQVNQMSANFPVAILWGGRIAPDDFAIHGGQLTLRRAADGAFTLAFGGGERSAEGNLADILQSLDALFTDTPLAEVREVAATDVTIAVEDARSGRVWQATNARATLRNTPDRIDLDVFSEVFNGTEDLAAVQLSFRTTKGELDAELAATILNAAAADLALQTPALSYLGLLDAPVSGAIRAVFDDMAELESLAATLDIAAGSLRPAGTVRPIAFNRGRAYLTYDPAEARLGFDEISVESDALRLTADGHAYLREFRGAWPQSMEAQLRVSQVAVAPEGLFENAVTLDSGIADLRVRLDPFRVDLGQVVFRDGDTTLRGQGAVSADPEGWQVGVTLAADRITPDRVLALWPLGAAPGARRWVAENLLDGQITDVNAGFRIAPGQAPAIGVTYDFEEARVRFLPYMPPLVDGRGHAAVFDNAYTMRLDRGIVVPEEGGAIDLTGSTIRIAPLDENPPRAEIGIRATAPLEAALTLLDNKPLEILQKAGRPADLAAATATVRATLGFRLLKEIPIEAVRYDVAATLSDVRSSTLIPNRMLTSDALGVTVVPGRLTLSGPVEVDSVPMNVVFDQPFGDGGLAPARVTGTMTLSNSLLSTFGVGLPPGTVGGEAPAEFTLDLPPGEPPGLWVSSDLGGLTLRIPALGVSKSAGTLGELSLDAALGPDPRIDRISLETLGFSAEGRVRLAPGGAFEALELDRLAAGRWLDAAAVTLENRGAGQAPRIRVDGGTMDLRARPDGGGGGAPVPVELRLDRVQITDEIAATNLVASLVSGNGLDGTFTALVNDGAPVRGRLAPQRGRTAIRVQGDNAGQILHNSGLFRSLEEGSFDLVLAPREEGPGFNGRLRIEDARLGDQPAIVDVLDAMSIVGILDQLRGPGIVFDSIEANFRLLPDRLLLDRAAAVGASLGVSLDGVYGLETRRLDMQGVLSPIYMLNSIGSVFTRRGEGLFGFTFKIRGAAENPSVSVNPLSILTPGMFREIFRRPPPGETQ